MKYLLLLMLMVSSPSSFAIEISDFQAGLMCGANIDSTGWICQTDEDIFVSGQSTCYVNNEVRPCTWYGFSFNYTNSHAEDLIECDYQHTVPIDSVNINEIVESEVTEGTFSFSVEPGDGFFLNPQYSVLTIVSKGFSDTMLVNCNFGDSQLFQYKLNIFYPSE